MTTIIHKQRFGSAWAGMLWGAMSVTGKGYRRPSLKRKAERLHERSPRRADKAGLTNSNRRYYNVRGIQ